MKKGTKILIGGLILVGVISAVGGNGEDKKETKTAKENKVVQEEVIKEEPKEEVVEQPKETQPVIEDKEITFTYEDGLATVDGIIHESIPDSIVTFDESSKTYIIQTMTFDANGFNEVGYAIQRGQISKYDAKELIGWDGMKESAEACSNTILQGLKQNGLVDAHVSIMISDTTGERVYMVVVDGVTIYDAFDEI